MAYPFGEIMMSQYISVVKPIFRKNLCFESIDDSAIVRS
jgi:hypothetical protein